MQAHVQPASADRPESVPFSFADTPRLTTALRAGDEDAFRWLYAHWNPRLLRFCFALAGGDDAIAAELAQAAYLRVFRHIRVLPDESAMWSWLACAARSAARDLRRTGGRYRRAIDRFAEWLRLRQFAQDQPSEDSRLLSALDAALANLPESDRELVEARYFERLPLQAMGSRWGTTARGIESRLARLRIRLRQLIAAELRRQTSLP